MSTKASAKSAARNVVQVKNPRTDRYVKIDRDAGRILSHKSSSGPYKNVPVARKKKMILYNPLDGDALTSSVVSHPRKCFLMTRLGKPIDPEVTRIRNQIVSVCKAHRFSVIDASSQVTGRDFLLKIWRQIASTPLAIGVCHESIAPRTQANIYYEMGVAQALGKETLLVKSRKAEVPSDFVRTEYVVFDNRFDERLSAYLRSLSEQAEHYEIVAAQLDRNPILAIDYLRRAFLITGDARLRDRAQEIVAAAVLDQRAKNSVELLAASF